MNTSDLPLEKSESWKMFDRISAQYDLLNRILSWGLDIQWRRQLTALLPPRDNQTVLDLATGTGDVAIDLMQRKRNVSDVYGIDLAENMLKIAEEKIRKAGLQNRIHLKKGDAQEIPFGSAYFDAVTMAFGIRNTPNSILVLKEIYRVLKDGGRVLILEFSLPRNPLIRLLHLFYLRTIVPFVGGLLSGNAQAYRYLNKTIEQYPHGERFCHMLRQVGFDNVRSHELLLGAATIYQGDKIHLQDQL